jgi:hypothetical protein
LARRWVVCGEDVFVNFVADLGREFLEEWTLSLEVHSDCQVAVSDGHGCGVVLCSYLVGGIVLGVSTCSPKERTDEAVNVECCIECRKAIVRYIARKRIVASFSESLYQLSAMMDWIGHLVLSPINLQLTICIVHPHMC